MQNTRDHKGQISIVDLFPDLTAQEQAAAEYAFMQYLDIVRRICERVSEENPELLTQLLREANVKEQSPKACLPQEPS